MAEVSYSNELLAKALGGDPVSQTRIGYCYALGIGIEKNEEFAINWWRKAADLNDSDAQYCLGRSYQRGFGVIQDYQESTFWLMIATINRHSEAEEFYMDVAINLTTNQLDSVRQRAMSFWSHAFINSQSVTS